MWLMLQSGVPEIIHIVQLPLYLPVFPVQIGCEDVLADQIINYYLFWIHSVLVIANARFSSLKQKTAISKTDDCLVKI